MNSWRGGVAGEYLRPDLVVPARAARGDWGDVDFWILLLIVRGDFGAGW